MSFIKNIGQVASKIGKVLKKSYGPLDALNPSSDESVRGLYRYPLDVGNVNLYPHTVEFHCYKPIPSGLPKDTESATKTFDKSGRDITPSYGHSQALIDKYGKGGPAINRNQAVNGERISDWQRRAELYSVIALYMPRQALQETINNNYEEKSMTDILGTLGMALEGGSSIINSFSKADTNWQGLKSAVKGMSPFAIEAAGRLAEKAGGFGMNDTRAAAEALIQSQGLATNPQFEIFYSGTSFRKFMFQYKLLPRSAKEADEILKIVRILKYHASPEYLESQGRYMAPPSYFDIYIKYRGEENDRIPLQLSTCVLTSLDIDMGSSTDQFVTFHDGTPLEIGIQMQFTELEIMHKRLRKDGY